MAMQRETRPVFEHTLFILPPAEDGSQPLWFGWIDERTKWHRAFPRGGELLAAAFEVLGRQQEWESGVRIGLPRVPNRACGTMPAVPEGEPRWSIRVTTDVDGEWMAEMLDESAWAVRDFDPRLLRDKLITRLGGQVDGDSNPLPVPFSLPALTGPDALRETPAPGPPDLRAAFAAEAARLATRREEIDRDLARLQAELAVLTREERALRAAEKAYAAHNGPSTTRRRRESS